MPATAIALFDAMTEEEVEAARSWLLTAPRLSRGAGATWGRAVASVPSEPRPVLGRLDRAGRLVSADPELEALQREAGSDARPAACACRRSRRSPSSRASFERPCRARRSPPRPITTSNCGSMRRPRATRSPCRSRAGPFVPRPGRGLPQSSAADAETETGGARNEWAADEELRHHFAVARPCRAARRRCRRGRRSAADPRPSPRRG